MRLEAFTEGKNLDAPEANEDQFVVLPGCGYAVIDGVTDISGRLVEGMSTGRFASRVVQRAVADIASDPAIASGPLPVLIQRISAAIQAGYVRLGILEEVRDHSQDRFGATLTLALDLGATFRFIFVGDSGLRINGADVVVDGAGLDRVTAVLRQDAFRIIGEAGGGLESKRRISRPRLVVTIALAAQYKDFFGVVGGTTLGMMLANTPVIYLGSRFADRLHPKGVHIVASIIFVVLGGIALRNALMNTPLIG